MIQTYKQQYSYSYVVLVPPELQVFGNSSEHISIDGYSKVLLLYKIYLYYPYGNRSPLVPVLVTSWLTLPYRNGFVSNIILNTGLTIRSNMMRLTAGVPYMYTYSSCKPRLLALILLCVKYRIQYFVLGTSKAQINFDEN